MEGWTLAFVLLFLLSATLGGVTQDPTDTHKRVIGRRQNDDDRSEIPTGDDFIGYYVDNDGKVSSMGCTEGGSASWHLLGGACFYTTSKPGLGEIGIWARTDLKCVDGGVSYTSASWKQAGTETEYEVTKADGTYSCAENVCATMSYYYEGPTYVPATPTCEGCGTVIPPTHARVGLREFVTCMDSMGLPAHVRYVYGKLPITSPAPPTPTRERPATPTPEDDNPTAEPNEERTAINAGVMAGAVVGSISGTAFIFIAYMLGRRRACRADKPPQDQPGGVQGPVELGGEPLKVSELHPEARASHLELEVKVSPQPQLSAGADPPNPGPYELHHPGVALSGSGPTPTRGTDSAVRPLAAGSVLREPVSAVEERSSVRSGDIRRTRTR